MSHVPRLRMQQLNEYSKYVRLRLVFRRVRLHDDNNNNNIFVSERSRNATVECNHTVTTRRNIVLRASTMRRPARTVFVVGRSYGERSCSARVTRCCIVTAAIRRIIITRAMLTAAITRCVIRAHVPPDTTVWPTRHVVMVVEVVTGIVVLAVVVGFSRVYDPRNGR